MWWAACLLDGPRGPEESEFLDPKWGPCHAIRRTTRGCELTGSLGKPSLALSVLKKPDGRLGDGSGFMGGRRSKTTRLYFIWTAQRSSVILGYFSPECFKEHILKGEVMWYFYLQIFCCLFSTRIIQISEERRVILLILVSEIIC